MGVIRACILAPIQNQNRQAPPSTSENIVAAIDKIHFSKMSSFFVPQSDTEPTLLDEIAKLFKCQKRLVRSRLQSPEYHAKAVAEFDESILITTYKDRNGQHRTLIFEGLTREGAHKIPAHGRLHFPFNSILPQFFLDRHNIKLQYPFTPVVIYSPGRSGGPQFYPLELVRLLRKPVHLCPPPPPFPTLKSPPPPMPKPMPRLGLARCGTPDDEDDCYRRPSSNLSTASSGSTTPTFSPVSSLSSLSSSRISMLESIHAPDEDDIADREPLLRDDDGDSKQEQGFENKSPMRRTQTPEYATITEDGGDLQPAAPYASVAVVDMPPPDARAYMRWTPIGDGKWKKKLVLIREYPNIYHSCL